MRAAGRIHCLALITCVAFAAPAAARAETVSVAGSPQTTHGVTKLPVLRASAYACGGLRTATLTAPAAALRRPGSLRAGDRISVRTRGKGYRARSVRVVRRSSAPTFSRVSQLISGTRSAAKTAGHDVAAIAALPPDAAGQRSFASAEQARALAQRLNFLDERLGALAAGLDRTVGSIERAFGAPARRCAVLKKARDRRTRALRSTATGARTASKGIQAGVSDIDSLLSFLPPDGLELPFGTVGTVTKVIQDLLQLLSDLTGGDRSAD